MKVHIKAKEDIEAQKYKFRPRSIRIEDILEVDVSSLMEFSADESLSPEWQEMMVGQDLTYRLLSYFCLHKVCFFYELVLRELLSPFRSRLLKKMEILRKSGTLFRSLF